MRNRRTWIEIKKHRQLYMLLLIPIIYIIVFHYIPMIGVQIGFRNYNFTDGMWRSPWVGFENFIKFFKAYHFKRIMVNTICLSFYGTFAGFPIPIVFALLLNVIFNIKYRKLIQLVTYMPHFISTVVMVGMMMSFLNPISGFVSSIYKIIGISSVPNLFGSAPIFRHLYVWSGIWQNMGWNTIIFMSVLSSSDPELHEAMQMDGASRFTRVIKLDLQCILPIATILLILNAGSIMNVGFEKVYLMQNNMNLSTSEVISTYVYKIGISASRPNYSYGTAIGFFNSVVNFFLLVFVNLVASRYGRTSLW